MKTEVRNEFILEAHKSACSEWKLKIEKECPELFKSKLEVGKWYKRKTSNVISFICNPDNGKVKSYGLNNNNFYDDSKRDDHWGYMNEVEGWALATEEEVKEALIKEAKKIGFNKQGNTLFCLEQQKNIFNHINEHAAFYYSFNKMYYNGICVYKNGEFSKIISNPIEEKINDLQKQIDELKKQL